MRPIVEYRSSSKQVYDKFRSLHPSVNISYKQWSDIIYTYNSLFREYILETGEVGKLPWGFGSFTISKKKTKKYKTFEGKDYINLRIDWAKTRSAGKKIYHFNSHTDGYNCRWWWFARGSRLYQPDTLIFKPSRESSRSIAKYLNKPGSHYIQIYKQWDRRS